MSDKNSALHAAKLAVMRKVGYVQKTGENTGQHYTYASEGDLVRALHDELAENGLTFRPSGAEVTVCETFRTANDKAMVHVLAVRTFTLSHESGESEQIVTLGEGMDTQDKAAYKAMTGAKKYALREAFLLECGDDPDADSNGGGRRTPTGGPPAGRPAPAALPPEDVQAQVDGWQPKGLEREGECHACGVVGPPERLREHAEHGLLCPGCMEDAARGEDPSETFDTGPEPGYARGASEPAPGEWVLPFGKHKGKKLKSAPKDYLEWCLGNMGDKLKDEARAKIRAYLEATRGG